MYNLTIKINQYKIHSITVLVRSQKFFDSLYLILAMVSVLNGGCVEVYDTNAMADFT